nr:hypothetical protein [Rubrobacteraceae bacterium]
MAYMLVPHQVTDTTATIWVGVADENEHGRQQVMGIEVDDGTETRTVALDASGWDTWKSYSQGDDAHYARLDRLLDRVLEVLKRPQIIRTLDYKRITLDNLRPRTSYSLTLHIEGQAATTSEMHLREARVTTLPAALPDQGQKAFTVLLGSCFYGPNDEEGMVGRTYYHLPKDRRPDIKILCGDQVYLDNPWLDTSLRYNGGNVRRGLFRAGFFQKYLDNWTQVRGEDAGFRQLLKDGANYFCSDDHEFWNNAPNFGGIGFINTLHSEQRDWWRKQARALFEIFQSPDPLIPFNVGQLSFRIADTRINRSITPERFMNDEDLSAVGRWIEGLSGPGVLVVGQPVLTEENSYGKALKADWNRTLWSALD